MESKEDSNSILDINEEKLLEQFLAQSIPDFNVDPSQYSVTFLEELDESKITDEFIKRQKVFEDSKEQWKSFIKMMASKYGNSKNELERISNLKIDVQALIEFLPKFQIFLENYESSLLLNEKHEIYQKLFNQIESNQKTIDNDVADFDLKKIYIGSVNKFYVEIAEYEKKMRTFKLNKSKIDEQLMKYDNKFKEAIEIVDQFREMIKKQEEEELKRSEERKNVRRKWNQIIEKPLKVIKMVEIDENGLRDPFLEMDTNEELGYTAKSFFLKKNENQNFYIHLFENKTGERIQEIMIKEFENEEYPRCKWNNAKEIGESKLVVFSGIQTFGFILEMDENSKRLKENYQKFEIGNDYNWQMIFSEKYAIINHDENGITVFDSKTLQKLENVQGSDWVIVGGFYDDDNYIYADDNKRILNYNLETKKQQIVNGNHPEGLVFSMNISKESNTLFLGHENWNVYIYKLNLENEQFASFQNTISIEDNNPIYRMEFISIDKLMIANGQNNLRIVDVKSGNIEEKEIIKGNELKIWDFKNDEKNGVIVVLSSEYGLQSISQIHFLSLSE